MRGLGDGDRMVTRITAGLAAAIPGAAFRTRPDTGHLPQIERPGPLAAAILGFTAGVSGRA